MESINIYQIRFTLLDSSNIIVGYKFSIINVRVGNSLKENLDLNVSIKAFLYTKHIML